MTLFVLVHRDWGMDFPPNPSHEHFPSPPYPSAWGVVGIWKCKAFALRAMKAEYAGSPFVAVPPDAVELLRKGRCLALQVSRAYSSGQVTDEWVLLEVDQIGPVQCEICRRESADVDVTGYGTLVCTACLREGSQGMECCPRCGHWDDVVYRDSCPNCMKLSDEELHADDDDDAPIIIRK